LRPLALTFLSSAEVLFVLWTQHLANTDVADPQEALMTLDAAYRGFLPLVRIFFLEKSIVQSPGMWWWQIREKTKTHEVVPEIDLPRACELGLSCWRIIPRPKSIPSVLSKVQFAMAGTRRSQKREAQFMRGSNPKNGIPLPRSSPKISIQFPATNYMK
jgi:hypothetical protein